MPIRDPSSGRHDSMAPIPGWGYRGSGSRGSGSGGITQVAGLVSLGPGQGVGLLGAAFVLVLQVQVAQLDQAAALVQQQVLQLHFPAGKRRAGRGRATPSGGCWPGRQRCACSCKGLEDRGRRQTPAAQLEGRQALGGACWLVATSLGAPSPGCPPKQPSHAASARACGGNQVTGAQNPGNLLGFRLDKPLTLNPEP